MPGAKQKSVVRKWDGTWTHDTKEFVVCSIAGGPLVLMPRAAFEGHNINAASFGGVTMLTELPAPSKVIVISNPSGDSWVKDRYARNR